MKKIEGLYTALITPFDEEDRLDEKCLRSLVARQVAARVSGIVVLGTTGEAPTLSHEERTLIIQIAVDEAQGKIPVMVGVGTYCTKTTIKYAKEAEKLGASSLLVVVPYYNKPTQEGIYEHFKAISAEVSLPICVYNIASRTGINLETSTLERLADLPRVVSVKEASGNLMQMTDVIERICSRKRGFSVLAGDDALAFPLIALGGHGVISVLSNLVPRAMKRLVDVSQEDIVKARAMHYSLKPLMQLAFIETNPAPIKRMMEIAGLGPSRTRLPLSSLTSINDAKLQETLKNSSMVWKETHTSPKSEAAISFKKLESEKSNFSAVTLVPN
jgi:4-hydroxy-tetrahydrodipicolinate synthase